MSSKKMLSCKVRRYPSKRLPRSLMTAPTKFKLVEGGNFQKAAGSTISIPHSWQTNTPIIQWYVQMMETFY